MPIRCRMVCDNALVIGYALGRKRIGVDVINEAAADLLSVEAFAEDAAPAEAPVTVSSALAPAVGVNRWRARVGVMGIVMAAIVLGLLSVGRTMLYKRAEEPLPPASEREPRLDGVRFAAKVVRPGDLVSQIALQKYGQATHTILDMLKLANPDLRDVDIISVGQTIKLPELGDGFPTLVEGSGCFALLVFSTPRVDQATNLQKALQEHGFHARVSEGKFGSQRQIYRVVLPGFTDRNQVAAAGRQLQKVLREDSRIAKLGE